MENLTVNIQDNKRKINIRSFPSELTNSIGRVSNSIQFHNLRFSTKALEKVISKAHNTPDVSFTKCILQAKNPVFDPYFSNEKSAQKTPAGELTVFKIEKISFCMMKNSDGSNWKKNSESLIGFLKGVKNCLLERSLREIEINE